MANLREIRADYDRESIVVYQAYPDSIADSALAAQRFVPPFSFHRMTWIKPSFLWLMHRSNWNQKSGQERTLAVRIRRAAFDAALGMGVLTSPERTVFRTPEEWTAAFAQAHVHIQWDPERTLRGAALSHYSIQVGLSRHVVRAFAEEWIVSIVDYTPLAKKIYRQIQSGQADKAANHLPKEKLYSVPPPIGRRLLMEPLS